MWIQNSLRLRASRNIFEPVALEFADANGNTIKVLESQEVF